ncbi:MAG: FAD-binding oxidoreductase [Candidatus Andeanibacterium colombiense]|uniref:FAD-binding oxidoreductase n=1 Tax=Candidatus Andeanibacterium colombiense TaxID=3121345 RepID=A0AAJ5X772_9SPHN|nr:MAG: FAD-binding oxidoreductase [Sphingomonadaceae bacterium]
MIAKGSPKFAPLVDELIWSARARDLRVPAAIVQPRSAAEVAAAVRLAGEGGMKVALRGSGHNYQGAALRDGGLLVDLGGLDRIDIDAGAHRARVGAGVKGGRLIGELARHGLAFPIGHCADVALSGYLLSGGIGWNYGEWGPACASVSAIEMVTADGAALIATANDHADLFWAARGAGCAFFAAVTGYELILHDLPAVSFALEAVFDAASAPDVAQWLDTARAGVDPTTELICMVGPHHETGKPSVTLRAIASGPTGMAARNKLGPLRELPAEAKLLAAVEETELSFAELKRFSAMPSGKRVAADQSWSDRSLGDLLLAVAHLAGGVQSSSAISLTALGQAALAPGLPDDVDGALSVAGRCSAGIYALWDGAEHDARHLAWVAKADAALAPLRTGRYIAEADLFAGPERVEECFSPEAFAQLTELRKQYDPTGRFFSCLDGGLR